MISHPAIGQVVMCWYRASLRPIAPHHSKLGIVVVKAGGRPRNHAILFADGSWTVVPAGNLRKPDSATTSAMQLVMFGEDAS